MLCGWAGGGAHAQGGGADPNRVDVICLDPGHGGKDPGAVGTGRYKTAEKDVALSVALLAGKYIEKEFPDVKVVYTRNDDRFIELMERSQIANRAKADLFISIHCNSNEKKEPYGTETYVMGLHKTEANMRVAMKENASILLETDHALKYEGFDPKDPESIIALSLRQNKYLDHSLEFSSLVQKQFGERVKRYDRGVKQAGFLVISYTTMPAVLTELGFLSNPEEEEFLQSSKGQDLLASAIFRAVKDYKAAREGASAKPPVKERPAAPVGEGAQGGAVAAGDSDVHFKVQFLTSSKQLGTSEASFNGLSGVQEIEGAGVWKYLVGDAPDLEGARKVQEACKGKGYDGAFIVAYRNGLRMDLQQAVNLTRDRQVP